MSSVSRADGEAIARAVPEKWQFVNVNEPKKNQDKDIISIVRAHAMRNVRRKQRLELTAQHQKRLKAEVPESDHTDSIVIADQAVQMNPNNWSANESASANLAMTLREMLSELEFVKLGYLANRSEAKRAAGCDEDAQCPDYWQRYREHDTRVPRRDNPGTSLLGTVTPESLVGDGVIDPFNALPITGCAKLNGRVLNHFTSVMALNCLPVDQFRGQNPLTERWLPYAMQDSTLFLATLTFAELHLEVLSRNYKSRSFLLHKGDSIKAVNGKLGDREHALSNEAIGAVAMLAAMESIMGNYKELRIHMDGLQRMVYMRGGLHELGWGHILHMFISWQDLLASALMDSAPRYKQTPCCLLTRDSSPCSDLIFPEPGYSTELCGEITASFQSMRDLTQKSNSGDQFKSILDRISFTKMRTDIVHHLLSIANQKPALEMTNLDYHVETCRLAALIYIKLALHMYAPLCAITRGLKAQLMNLIEQGEANCTIGLGARQQPASIRWALFIGGILSLNKEEEEWFAVRLAKGIRVSGLKTWAEMEKHLGQICWRDELNTPICRSVWRRVERIHAEYWAAQTREAASDCDRRRLFYWYPDSE